MATATETPVLNDPFEMTASSSGGDFELCPAGNHPALLVAIIDIGTQEETYNGETKEVRKVVVVWELPGEIKADGSPFYLAKEFTNSFNEKAKLRLMVEGWRGKKFQDDEKFSLTTLMMKPCLAGVTHKTNAKNKTFAELSGISAVPKGMTVPKAQADPILYAIASGNEPPDHDWLPRIYGNKIADLVRDSREWKAAHKPTAAVGQAAGDDSDIPF